MGVYSYVPRGMQGAADAGKAQLQLQLVVQEPPAGPLPPHSPVASEMGQREAVLSLKAAAAIRSLPPSPDSCRPPAV